MFDIEIPIGWKGRIAFRFEWFDEMGRCNFEDGIYCTPGLFSNNYRDVYFH